MLVSSNVIPDCLFFIITGIIFLESLINCLTNCDIFVFSIQCALNVIIGIGRRRKVTQSLKSKESQSKRKVCFSLACNVLRKLLTDVIK